MRLGTSVRLLAVVAVSTGLARGAAAAVSGRVLTTDGAPVAGATVEGFEKEDGQAVGLRRVAGKGPTPIVTAKSGPDGAFRLEARTHVSWVQATAEGFGPAVGTPDEPAAMQLTLKRAGRKRGVVRADGQPVANAVVVWSTHNGGELLTRTDASGAFEAPDPEEVPGRLDVFHPDHEPGSAFLDGARGTSLDQALEPGVSIAGRAVDAGGRAVANATVWVDGSWPVARTDAKGAFTIPHASSSWSSVSVRTPGVVGVAGRKVGPLVVTVKPERTLTGLITDAATRQPVAGALVVVQTPAGQETAETDARGRYTLAGLPAATYRPYAGRSGYVSGPPGHDLSKGIDLRTAMAGRFDVALERLAQVRGRVVDESGQPVEGALVGLGFRDTPNLYVPDMMAGIGMGAGDPVVSGPDGAFTLTLSPNEGGGMAALTSGDRPILALKRGYAAAQAPFDKTKNVPVVVSLPRGLPLRGRVTDASGAPLAGVAIKAAEEGSVGGSLFPTRMILGRSGKDAWVVTDDQGRFELFAHPVPHHLQFRKPGYAPRITSGNDPRARTDVEATLEPAAFVRGRVSRADGRGVEGVQVMVMTSSGMDGEMATTAADGTFAVSDLAPGEYQLMARHAELAIEVNRVVEAPAAEVEIVLDPAVTVRGTVLDSGTRQPVPTFSVHVATDTDGEDGWRSTEVRDSSGAFAVEDVPAGRATVTVTAEGYAQRKLEDLELQADAPPEPIEVLLEADTPLRGRVTGPSGEAVANARVSVRGGEGARANANEDGEYEVRGLPAGTLKLTFGAEGYTSEERTVDTRQTPRLDVTLKRGLSLKGVVVQNGAGVPNAFVGASTSARGAGYDRARTDEQGRFTIEGLVPGRYTVTAQAEDKGTAKLEDVDVETAGPLRLNLEKGLTAVLTGRVVGLPGGELAMAMVMAVNQETGQSARSGIDDARTFRMNEAPAGAVTVSAFAGSLEGGGSARNSRPLSLVLAPGSETEAVIEFADDATVSGVVTRDGAPVPHVMVSFAEEGGMGAMGRTDTSGAYHVSGLAPGQYLVHVMGERLAYQTRYTVTGTGEFDIDVTGGTLAGRVVNADGGTPVNDVTLAIFRPGENENTPEATLTTGTQGTFMQRSLREGRLRVVTSKAGFGQEVRDVELASGGAANLVIELSPADGVSVTVVDARNQRPLEAIVVVRDQGKRIVANRHSGADENGVLNIPLADGSYLLSTSASGYGTVTMPVTSPANGLRVALTPGGTIVIESTRELKGRVRLIQPDGEEYVRCWCNGIAEIQLKGRRTTVENVTPGRYTLQVVDSPEGLQPRAVVVLEGQTTTVSLE